MWDAHEAGADPRSSQVDEPDPAAVCRAAYGAKVATAELETHEVQDLADQIDELRQVTAGHALHIRVTVEVGEAGKVEQEVVDRVNGVLGKIKTGWQIN